jgi:hypothetical protein
LKHYFWHNQYVPQITQALETSWGRKNYGHILFVEKKMELLKELPHNTGKAKAHINLKNKSK